MTTLCFNYSQKRLVREAKLALSSLAVFGAAVLVMHGCSGCKPVLSADESYNAKIIACASTGKTHAEIAACKAAVNREYNVCENPGGWPAYVPCEVKP